MSEKANIKSLRKEKNRKIRRKKLNKKLREHASRSQKSLRKWMKDKKISGRKKNLWIINGLAVKLTPARIRKLAKRADVAEIRLDAVVSAPVSASGSVPAVAEWNISAIKADKLWSKGVTGQGVVIASMDTGVDILHQDIATRWRGGTNSWFDPNNEHLTPYDANGHGTQTMGIMVGGDAGGTSIGVAPDAQWIAVKIFDDYDFSSLSKIHQGFQWLLDPDGNPDTDDAPDIVNNSWNLYNTLNTCNTEFQADIDLLRGADIAVLFSAGNQGDFSETSVSPANNNGSFATGAVDEFLEITYFSSRGSSACGGGLYPQVSAPGFFIYTSDITFDGFFPDSYMYVDGTSFAAPHVAGAMALLKSSNPSLTVAELEAAIQQTALDGGISGADNNYGWGIVDVDSAYTQLNTTQ